MRIRIKSEDTNLNIPLPMWLVKTGVKISAVVGKNQAKKALSKNSSMNVNKSNKSSSISKYIDMIDYKILNKAMDELETYKGLVLVEVHASDGTEVLITV